MGIAQDDLQNPATGDAKAELTNRRMMLVQTMGNLTILTQELNSSVSNSDWATKKPALLSASLLPINQKLHAMNLWDETAIESRSDELFGAAIKLWRGPQDRQ